MLANLLRIIATPLTIVILEKLLLPHIQLDVILKIIGAVGALIGIGAFIRRVVRGAIERAAPSELRRFSFSEYIDYEHRRTSEPAVFRFAGPVAADFEQGYVYFRPEVDLLLSEIENQSLVAVMGLPAAGKTVVLRSLGYKILQGLPPVKRKNVYLIPLKELTVSQAELAKLRNLQKSAVVIIDDCHLDRVFTEKLIAPPVPQCRMFLFSRRAELADVESGAHRKSAFSEAFESAIEIKAHGAASEIVSLYSDKTHVRIGPEANQAIVERYGENLMILIWALDTYKSKNSLAETDVARTAARWLLPAFGSSEGFYQDLREKDRRKIHSDETAVVLLVLASSYRYEFSLSRLFIEKDLQIKRNHVDLLLKSRMITDDEGRIGLPHSSLAALFVKAAATPILDETIATIESRLPGSFPDGVLRLYVTRRPQHACRLLYSISTWSQGGADSIRSISENNEAVIARGIVIEEDLNKIAGALRQVLQVTEPTALNIIENNPEVLETIGNKLRMAELDWKSADCINAVADISESSALSLIPSIEIQMNTAGVSWVLGDYIHKIATQHETIALALVPTLIEKTRTAELGYELGEFIGALSPFLFLELNEELESLLHTDQAKSIAFKLLPVAVDKILQSSDPLQLAYFVGGIRTGSLSFDDKSYHVGYELASAIAERLDAESKPSNIALCILVICEEDRKMAKAIFQALGPQTQEIIYRIRANPPTEEARVAVEKLVS